MSEEPENKAGNEIGHENSIDRTSFTPPSAKELSLKEIKGKEERVAVIGKIISINKPALTGKISADGLECSITFTEGEQLLGLSNGSVVRVIGEPSKEKGLQIEAEIVQELKGFDSNLYSKVKELEKKYYSGEA